MKEPKFILLLKSLDKNEFREFGNFIRSPFFVSNKKVSEYFEIISEYYPDFNEDNINDENIFKLLYPGKSFYLKQMKYLKTKLTQSVETYLGIVEYQKNEFEKMFAELRQLGRKDLQKEFHNKLTDITSLLENTGRRNNEYYLRSYLLKKEMRDFYEIRKSLGKRAEYFEEIKDELDEFVIYIVITMLKYYVIMRNQEIHLSSFYKYHLHQELMTYAKENLIGSHPLVKIFYLLNLMFENEQDDSIFFELKEFVGKNNDILEKDDAELVYTGLFNYSKIKYIQDKPGFGSENALILKYMISNNLYPEENGYMTQNTFINAASTGLREKDYLWVKEFIDKYSNMVAPDKKMNLYNYAMGMLHYRKKEYSLSLDHFAKVKIDDFYYYLRIKNHLMKIYYETNDIEVLLSTIDSFKHYMNTHTEIPDFIKERFQKFTNYLSGLISAKEHEDEFKLNNLRETINSSPAFENKSWLLEMLEELIPQRDTILK